MGKTPERLAFVLPAVLIAMVVVLVGCVKSPVNTDRHGWAVKGYDVVAYFTQGKTVQGTDQYTDKWQGAIWRFANARHLDAFKADPERYAPQYGGY